MRQLSLYSVPSASIQNMQCLWENSLHPSAFHTFNNPNLGHTQSCESIQWSHLSPLGQAGAKIKVPKVFIHTLEVMGEGSQKVNDAAGEISNVIRNAAQRLNANPNFERETKILLLDTNSFRLAHHELGPDNARSPVLRQENGMILIDLEVYLDSGPAEKQAIQQAINSATMANFLQKSPEAEEMLIFSKKIPVSISEKEQATSELADYLFRALCPQASKEWENGDIRADYALHYKKWLPEEVQTAFNDLSQNLLSKDESKQLIRQAAIPYTILQSYTLLVDYLHEYLLNNPKPWEKLESIIFDSKSELAKREAPFTHGCKDRQRKHCSILINLDFIDTPHSINNRIAPESIFHEVVHNLAITAGFDLKNIMEYLISEVKNKNFKGNDLIKKYIEIFADPILMNFDELLPNFLLNEIIGNNHFKEALDRTMRDHKTFNKKYHYNQNGQSWAGHANAFTIMQSLPKSIIHDLLQHFLIVDNIPESHETPPRKLLKAYGLLNDILMNLSSETLKNFIREL